MKYQTVIYTFPAGYDLFKGKNDYSSWFQDTFKIFMVIIRLWESQSGLLSLVWQQTELDNTKVCYQLIVIIRRLEKFIG